MANTKSRRHTHKYYKCYRYGPKIKGEFLWTCALPDCSHHMPKHMETMLSGKMTICWKCAEPTTLDDRTLHMDKPLCEECDINALPLPKLDEETITIGEQIHGKDEIEETKRILAQFGKTVDAGEDYNDE